MNEIEKFNDIEILNLSKCDDFYGPIFPNFEKSKHLMQKRGKEVICSEISSLRVDSLCNKQTIDFPLLWCGSYHYHYGHLICEHMSRILVYKEANIKGKLCFSIHEKINVSDFFWEIIRHFGYSNEDVFFIDKPTIAKTLYVTPQNETIQQKNLTSEFYLDLLDKNYPPKPISEKKGIVYVSRSKLTHRSYPKLAGEEYLEKYFRECGIEVIYPEQMSVEEQVKLYNSSRLIIMVEGSAYHTFQLLGRAMGDILIIKRRNIYANGGWVRNVILPRCNSLKYISELPTLIPGRAVDKKTQRNFLKESHGLVLYGIGLLIEIMNIVRKTDKTIPNIEISKIEYDQMVLVEYDKYIKNEAEKINFTKECGST